MGKILRYHGYVISALIFLTASPLRGVFISAFEYKDPNTGKQILLLGDLHCDLDAQGTLTRLQREAVLQEARKRNAFIIVENCPAPAYNPYKWMGLIGINMAFAYKILLVKNYIALLNPVIMTGLISKFWYDEWLQTQIPSVSFNDHINSFKLHEPSTKLSLFGHTPLKRLVEDAKARGLDATDKEFRYHFLTAHYEWMKQTNGWPVKANCLFAQAQHWIMRKMTGDTTRYPLTVADYWKTQHAVLKKIESFNDSNDRINDFYKECIAHYNDSYITQALCALEHTNPDYSLKAFVQDYAREHQKEFQEVYTEFRDHNKELLDALIVHEIAQENSAQSIFVCTGVDHTMRLCALLKSLGYQETRGMGKDNFTQLTAANAVNQTYIEAKNIDYITIDLQKFFE